MSATSLKPVIEKLESLFSSFNQKFYNGELQTPVITVSPDTTKGAYGWCTSWKAWSNLDPDSKTTDISQISKADLDAMQNEGFYYYKGSCVWTLTVYGAFYYDGKTSACTGDSVTYSTSSGWSCNSASSSHSGSSATAHGTFTGAKTVSDSVSISCDSKGNLS